MAAIKCTKFHLQIEPILAKLDYFKHVIVLNESLRGITAPMPCSSSDGDGIVSAGGGVVVSDHNGFVVAVECDCGGTVYRVSSFL